MVGYHDNDKDKPMSDITVVTAFFDIGRSNWNKTPHGLETPHYIPRSTESYFSYFENLAKIKNDMVIYCSEEHADQISKIRERNAPEAETTIVPLDFQNSVKHIKPVIEKIQKNVEYIKFVNDPRMPEYWNADYVLVNFLKTEFVVDAYKKDYIKTDLAAWLDFGYVRSEKTLPKKGKWSYDFDPSKMHYFNKKPIDFERPIFDIIRTNDVYIMGCHLVGGKDAWFKHLQQNMQSLASMLNCGLIDDDQTILLMNYRMDPNSFELHPINVKKEEWDEWNIAMLKFNKE